MVNTDTTVNYSIREDVFDNFTVDSIIWTINGTRYNCNLVDCDTIVQTFKEVGQYEFVVTVYYDGSCQVDARLTVKTQSIIITEVPNILTPEKQETIYFCKNQ